jgi:hypothetical protein
MFWSRPPDKLFKIEKGELRKNTLLNVPINQTAVWFSIYFFLIIYRNSDHPFIAFRYTAMAVYEQARGKSHSDSHSANEKGLRSDDLNPV